MLSKMIKMLYSNIYKMSSNTTKSLSKVYLKCNRIALLLFSEAHIFLGHQHEDQRTQQTGQG